MKDTVLAVMAATLGLLLGSSSASAEGSTYITAIRGIEILSGSAAIALVTFETDIYGSPSCSTQDDRMAIDLSTAKGRSMLSLANTMLLARRLGAGSAIVVASGTGRCSVKSGIETMASIFTDEL